MSKKFSLALVLSLLSTSIESKKCTAIALSGGSNHGAWEAGLMWGLVHYGKSTDYMWDVVTGVSAGAINAAGMAGWRPDEQIAMTNFMSE